MELTGTDGIFTSRIKDGWILYSASPLPPGQNLPDELSVELQYSAGEWKSDSRYAFAADYHGVTSIAKDATVGPVGQTAGGNAFVTITLDLTQTRDTQFDFTATTKDAKQIDHYSMFTSGPLHLATQQFEFDVPLEKVKSFQLRTRPIQTAVFDRVPTHPGAATQPATQPDAHASVKQEAGKAIVLFVHNGSLQLHMGEQAIEAAEIEIKSLDGQEFVARVTEGRPDMRRKSSQDAMGFCGDRIEILPSGQISAYGGPVYWIENALDAKNMRAAAGRPATQPATQPTATQARALALRLIACTTLAAPILP